MGHSQSRIGVGVEDDGSWAKWLQDLERAAALLEKIGKISGSVNVNLAGGSGGMGAGAGSAGFAGGGGSGFAAASVVIHAASVTIYASNLASGFTGLGAGAAGLGGSGWARGNGFPTGAFAGMSVDEARAARDVARESARAQAALEREQIRTQEIAAREQGRTAAMMAREQQRTDASLVAYSERQIGLATRHAGAFRRYAQEKEQEGYTGTFADWRHREYQKWEALVGQGSRQSFDEFTGDVTPVPITGRLGQMVKQYAGPAMLAGLAGGAVERVASDYWMSRISKDRYGAIQTYGWGIGSMLALGGTFREIPVLGRLMNLAGFDEKMRLQDDITSYEDITKRMGGGAAGFDKLGVVGRRMLTEAATRGVRVPASIGRYMEQFVALPMREGYAGAYQQQLFSTAGMAGGSHSGGLSPQAALNLALASGDWTAAAALHTGNPAGVNALAQRDALARMGVSIDGSRMAQYGSQIAIAQRFGRGHEAAGLMERRASVARNSIANIDSQIGDTERLLGTLTGPENEGARLAAQERIERLRAEREQLRVTAETGALDAIETRFGHDFGMGQSSARIGRAWLSTVTGLGQMPGREMDAAFGRMGAGLDRQLGAARTKLKALQGLPGVDPSLVRAAEAEVAELESQRTLLPIERARTEYGARAAVAGAATSMGQTALAGLNLTQFYGPGTAAAYGEVRRGLGAQVGALEQELSAFQKAGAGEALTAPIRAEIARLKLAIKELALSEFRQVYEDLRARPAATSAGVGARLGAMLGTGQLPGAEFRGFQGGQAAATRQLTAIAKQEYEDAVRQFKPDSRQALEAWTRWQQAIAAEQQLPLRQIEERFANPMGVEGARSAGATAGARAIFAAGGGAREALDERLNDLAAQRRLAKLEWEKLQEMEAQARRDPNSVGPRALEEQRTRFKEVSARVADRSSALGNAPLPVEIEERLSQTRYASSVLERVPGSYGNLRGALQGEFGEIGKAGEYLLGYREKLRQKGELTPTAEHAINQQLRELGLQQADVFNQLSHGWESRLMSQMMGTPGNFDFIAHQFTMRDAVGAGIVNPHFGSRSPFFLEQARLTGSLFGATGTPMGFNATGFGMAAGLGSGDLSGMPGMGTAHVIHHREEHVVVLKYPDGSEAGRVNLSRGSGSVTQEAFGGGLEDYAAHAGLRVARQ